MNNETPDVAHSTIAILIILGRQLDDAILVNILFLPSNLSSDHTKSIGQARRIDNGERVKISLERLNAKEADRPTAQ